MNVILQTLVVVSGHKEVQNDQKCSENGPKRSLNVHGQKRLGTFEPETLLERIVEIVHVHI